MRIASGLVKDHHVVTVAIFLTVAALVVGAAACDGARTYQLTISSGAGGNVTTLGEGTFAYAAGTMVPLVAAPDDGYQFRSWTGDIANIADRNAASTSITMNGNHAIVANFETGGGTGPGNGGHTQP
jgi:hypothetical protein